MADPQLPKLVRKIKELKNLDNPIQPLVIIPQIPQLLKDHILPPTTPSPPQPPSQDLEDVINLPASRLKHIEEKLVEPIKDIFIQHQGRELSRFPQLWKSDFPWSCGFSDVEDIVNLSSTAIKCLSEVNVSTGTIQYNPLCYQIDHKPCPPSEVLAPPQPPSLDLPDILNNPQRAARVSPRTDCFGLPNLFAISVSSPPDVIKTLLSAKNISLFMPPPVPIHQILDVSFLLPLCPPQEPAVFVSDKINPVKNIFKVLEIKFHEDKFVYFPLVTMQDISTPMIDEDEDESESSFSITRRPSRQYHSLDESERSVGRRPSKISFSRPSNPKRKTSQQTAPKLLSQLKLDAPQLPLIDVSDMVNNSSSVRLISERLGSFPVMDPNVPVSNSDLFTSQAKSSLILEPPQAPSVDISDVVNMKSCLRTVSQTDILDSTIFICQPAVIREVISLHKIFFTQEPLQEPSVEIYDVLNKSSMSHSENLNCCIDSKITLCEPIHDKEFFRPCIELQPPQAPSLNIPDVPNKSYKFDKKLEDIVTDVEVVIVPLITIVGIIKHPGIGLEPPQPPLQEIEDNLNNAEEKTKDMENYEIVCGIVRPIFQQGVEQNEKPVFCDSCPLQPPTAEVKDQIISISPRKPKDFDSVPDMVMLSFSPAPKVMENEHTQISISLEPPQQPTIDICDRVNKTRNKEKFLLEPVVECYFSILCLGQDITFNECLKRPFWDINTSEISDYIDIEDTVNIPTKLKRVVTTVVDLCIPVLPSPCMEDIKILDMSTFFPWRESNSFYDVPDHINYTEQRKLGKHSMEDRIECAPYLKNSHCEGEVNVMERQNMKLDPPQEYKEEYENKSNIKSRKPYFSSPEISDDNRYKENLNIPKADIITRKIEQNEKGTCDFQENQFFFIEGTKEYCQESNNQLYLIDVGDVTRDTLKQDLFCLSSPEPPVSGTNQSPKKSECVNTSLLENCEKFPEDDEAMCISVTDKYKPLHPDRMTDCQNVCLTGLKTAEVTYNTSASADVAGYGVSKYQIFHTFLDIKENLSDKCEDTIIGKTTNYEEDNMATAVYNEHLVTPSCPNLESRPDISDDLNFGHLPDLMIRRGSIETLSWIKSDDSEQSRGRGKRTNRDCLREIKKKRKEMLSTESQVNIEGLGCLRSIVLPKKTRGSLTRLRSISSNSSSERSSATSITSDSPTPISHLGSATSKSPTATSRNCSPISETVADLTTSIRCQEVRKPPPFDLSRSNMSPNPKKSSIGKQSPYAYMPKSHKKHNLEELFPIKKGKESESDGHEGESEINKTDKSKHNQFPSQYVRDLFQNKTKTVQETIFESKYESSSQVLLRNNKELQEEVAKLEFRCSQKISATSILEEGFIQVEQQKVESKKRGENSISISEQVLPTTQDGNKIEINEHSETNIGGRRRARGGDLFDEVVLARRSMTFK